MQNLNMDEGKGFDLSPSEMESCWRVLSRGVTKQNSDFNMTAM